jgi:6-pyruvoyltetrahydropterin/6-carboxytetrahydropterin synthase
MMQKQYFIERKIEIDAGHRVTHHGSKCKNLHGHRYTVIAVCQGSLVEAGEQQGMVMDFGFLKASMMQAIHDGCDHAMILWDQDPLAHQFVGDPARFAAEIVPQLAATGYYHTQESMVGALYLINAVPTAENLAAHWYDRLAPLVASNSHSQAQLHQIKVFETPNCMAVYPAFPLKDCLNHEPKSHPA